MAVDAELKEGTAEYDLVWWMICPVCGMAWHVADLHCEVVKTGQKIHHVCDNCGTRIVKTVKKDLGSISMEAETVSAEALRKAMADITRQGPLVFRLLREV